MFFFFPVATKTSRHRNSKMLFVATYYHKFKGEILLCHFDYSQDSNEIVLTILVNAKKCGKIIKWF